jgi:hypothetical protein
VKSIDHSTIIAAILCGTTALLADVTASRFWDNWTDQMAVYGRIHNRRRRHVSGGTLTVSDVKG